MQSVSKDDYNYKTIQCSDKYPNKECCRGGKYSDKIWFKWDNESIPRFWRDHNCCRIFQWPNNCTKRCPGKVNCLTASSGSTEAPHNSKRTPRHKAQGTLSDSAVSESSKRTSIESTAAKSATPEFHPSPNILQFQHFSEDLIYLAPTLVQLRDVYKNAAAFFTALILVF